MKVVTAVRVDGKTGMVGRVKWGVWDHSAEKWAEAAVEADVDEVVRALDHKHDVYALITFDGVNKAVGPKLWKIADRAGNESIDFDQITPGVSDSIAFTWLMDKF